MKNKTPMKKISEVDLKIVKMIESSGNEQFFVRLVRNDSGDGFFGTDNIVEHSCWQTLKNGLPKKECLERAWFDAGFIARFLGLTSYDEIILVGFNEEETKIIKSAKTLFRPAKK